jgi:hypothetical protein
MACKCKQVEKMADMYEMRYGNKDGLTHPNMGKKLTEKIFHFLNGLFVIFLSFVIMPIILMMILFRFIFTGKFALKIPKFMVHSVNNSNLKKE